MTLSSFVRPIIFWTTIQSQDHADYLLFRFFFFLVVSVVVVVVAAAVVFVIIVVSRNKKKETRVQILSYYY
jgi:heme/copper-type cytochrome/quinol oxidase subunit 2